MTRSEIALAIAENIRQFARVKSEPLLRHASVAVVVLQGGSQPCVPVFQRTHTMSRHAGQMALPGGIIQAGESDTQCAIRELHEELGLVVGEKDVLGRLDDFNTKSGFTITPFVVWSEAETSTLRPSKAEVERLFLFTLDELREAVSAANLHERTAFSLRFRSVQIFAPTAAILYQFSEVALSGRTCRVADFYQPPFAHR